MKIFVQIVSQRGRGGEEAAENRNYLACRMTDEVGEIIRVLQLVTYDEEDWSSDNIQVMKKTIANIDSKMQPAMDWLRDPEAVQAKDVLLKIKFSSLCSFSLKNGLYGMKSSMKKTPNRIKEKSIQI